MTKHSNQSLPALLMAMLLRIGVAISRYAKGILGVASSPVQRNPSINKNTKAQSQPQSGSQSRHDGTEMAARPTAKSRCQHPAMGQIRIQAQNFFLTKAAAIRMQRLGVSLKVLRYLLEHGRKQWCDGVKTCFLPKKKCRVHLPHQERQLVEQCRNMFVLFDPNTFRIITVARMY